MIIFYNSISYFIKSHDRTFYKICIYYVGLLSLNYTSEFKRFIQTVLLLCATNRKKDMSHKSE